MAWRANKQILFPSVELSVFSSTGMPARSVHIADRVDRLFKFQVKLNIFKLLHSDISESSNKNVEKF